MCDTRIVAITKQVVEMRSDDPHLQAIQAQVTLASTIFDGMVRECANENGLAAEVLLRTLFEAVTGTVILAKHPEKLEQFKRHARYTELGGLRSISDPALEPMVKELVKNTEAEFQTLVKEFRQERWHLIKTRESFVE